MCPRDEPGTLLLCGPGTWRDGSSLLAFRAPRHELTARRPDDLLGVLAGVERRVADGYVVAGLICYEAAAAFGLATRPSRGPVPLAWFGVYEPGCAAEVGVPLSPALPARSSGGESLTSPTIADADRVLRPSPPAPLPGERGARAERGRGEGGWTSHQADPARPMLVPMGQPLAPPEPVLSVAPHEHAEAVRRIKEWIAAGDTYQVNYTCRARFPAPGPPLPYFVSLLLSHPVPYGAYLDLGDAQVLSLSPELLLRRRGNTLESRPMKGTRPRGTTERSDVALAEELAASPKDRAENLMIVDMVRNDLGRVCEAGSVEVPELFSLEKYRTVWQMTSTVRGRLRDGTGLSDIVAAVFPGASVTGAPKVRTMELIRELESEPRGVYCGAIALLEPGGDFTLSLPIRTITHVGGRCELGIGGGIVWDSEPEAEYDEAVVKSRFAFRLMPDLELWETMLVDEHGTVRHEGAHLARLASSADSWGIPFEADQARARLHGELGALDAPCVLRLELHQDGRLTFTHRAVPSQPGRPARVVISGERTDPSERLLYHKTNHRALYDREREAAIRNGYDEVLFRNASGNLTEGAITNLFVRFADGWVTPPIEEGLLPGIWRAEFLAEVGAREEPVTVEALGAAAEVVIGNSVRGAITVGRIDLDGRPAYRAEEGPGPG